MTPIVSAITTWADGFGRWRARLAFTHTLSESDPRPEFNLLHQWSRIRRAARDAVVREIAGREQKTWESRPAAEQRVRASLPQLVVVKQGMDSLGLWHGVIIGEP